MKIFLGSDHGGFALKTEIAIFLKEHFPESEIVDIGCNSEDSVDYPSFGASVAREVVMHSSSFGIVFCGSGIGISIAANKIPGARVALCTNSTMANLARRHNNANILALGGRITEIEIAKDIVKTFFKSSFEGGRHQRRIEQIAEIEHEYQKKEI